MEDLIPAVIGVLLVVVVGVLLPLAVRDDRAAQRLWERITRARGLSFRPGGWFSSMEATGLIDGIAVRVSTVVRGDGSVKRVYTKVEARPGVPLPEGLCLTQEDLGTALVKALGGQDIPLSDTELDGRLRVRGAEPALVQAVLERPEARPALRIVAEGEAFTCFEDGALVVETAGYALNGLDALIDTAVAGARGLEAAVRAPWAELARERGYRHEESARSATLDGRAGGMSVLVRAQYASGQARTTVTVQLDGGLPRGLRIRAGAGCSRLGDPVLDGRVVVEGTSGSPEPSGPALAWLRKRLAASDMDLHGCLLDVLQTLPGATVEDGVLSWSVDRRLGVALPEVLDRMTALGAALSEGSALSEEMEAAAPASRDTAAASRQVRGPHPATQAQALSSVSRGGGSHRGGAPQRGSGAGMSRPS